MTTYGREQRLMGVCDSSWACVTYSPWACVASHVGVCGACMHGACACGACVVRVWHACNTWVIRA